MDVRSHTWAGGCMFALPEPRFQWVDVVLIRRVHGRFPASRLSSWGGSIVKDRGNPGLYHLFVAEMSRGCGLDAWCVTLGPAFRHYTVLSGLRVGAEGARCCLLPVRAHVVRTYAVFTAIFPPSGTATV